MKFLPFGRAGDFQPYAGGGLAILNWEYSEVGEFVDFSDGGTIFRDRYVAEGNAMAPIVFGGVRVPIGGDVFAFNGEVRWQGGKGDQKEQDDGPCQRSQPAQRPRPQETSLTQFGGA